MRPSIVPRAAKAAGYDVELRYVALENVALNIQRVRARAAGGRHFIAPAHIRRRYAGSLANLPNALAIVDRAILADNSGAVHRVVLEMAGGRITRVVSDLPGWLVLLIPRILAPQPLAPGATSGRNRS